MDTQTKGINCRPAASPLAALLAFERLAHGRLLTLAFVVWIAFQWVLPFFIAPQFLLAFSLAYAALMATRVAGSDALEGTQELTLGLPFTRRQLYKVRLAFAGLPLAVILGIGLAALRFEWVQAVWSLVVETGFAEPFTSPGADAGRFPWYGIALALPLLSFACTFVIAAMTSSPRAQPLLWFPGLAAAVTVVGLALLIEIGLWSYATGWIATPSALSATIAVLAWGLVAFERKDGVGETMRGDQRFWPVSLGLAAAAAVLVVGLLFTAAVVSRHEAAVWASRRAQSAAKEAQLRMEELRMKAEEDRARDVRLEHKREEEK